MPNRLSGRPPHTLGVRTDPARAGVGSTRLPGLAGSRDPSELRGYSANPYAISTLGASLAPSSIAWVGLTPAEAPLRPHQKA
jgi:hypothetical protein